ncbi:MAG: CAP domain-containing protein [Opitutae bacterium]|nr:CAP domain-containing protein [Opitutae bacterium]
MLRFTMFLLTVALAQGAPASRGTDLSAPEFWAQPALDARIDVAHFNRELMAAAIFHETNRVRGKLGLRLFRTLPKLDEAADLEAAVGKVYQPPSHTNPFPMIGTPAARVGFVGLKARQVAENIALLPRYDVEAGAGVGVIMREGRRHFVNFRTQAELQPATYRGFAALVVRAWMDSPGHRANIVASALTHLGCSVQPSVSIAGVDNLFCVQVFFTPAGQD